MTNAKTKENGKQSPLVTVVVVPRESFNMFAEVVQRIYDVTPGNFKMLIMEGRAPQDRREELEAIAAKQSHCKVIYSQRWKIPSDLVNDAIKLVDTKYAVFVDNDVEVAEGWLDALVSCAEEENVDCVHPIYLTTQLANPAKKIHVAEGKLVREKKGDRWYVDTIATYSGVSLEDYPDQKRKPSEFFEWHCVLFSKKLLDQVGPLNDLNICEHLDYTFRVQEAGFQILLEPKSVVAYDYERIFKFRGADREYMLYRWDINRCARSHDSFREKWKLVPEATARRQVWAQKHTGKVRNSYFKNRVINKLRRIAGLQNLTHVRDEEKILTAETQERKSFDEMKHDRKVAKV